MTTYNDDILEFRQKFAFVDKKSPKALKRWFNSHPHLSTNDHAQIADRSLNYIRKLRKIAGIKGKTPANLPKSTAVRKIVNLIPPENWDDPEWLNKVAGIYPVGQIAKACGVSNRTVGRRLQKYNITKKVSTKSKNKCCTRDWCLKHYVELGLSQDKCAKKANVCQQAFANWLNRFKIPVRTSSETQKSHTNVRLWVRELFGKLEAQPTVRRVYLRSNHIHVRFMNYFWETYFVNEIPNKRRPPLSYVITKEDARLQNVPQVLPEYEADMFEETYDENKIIKTPHIIINRRDLNKASLIEKRIAVHEYCRQITQRKWMWPEHPEKMLQNEWAKLCNFKPSKYMWKDTFSVFARSGKNPAPGRRIVEHFFDINEFSAVFRSPRLVMRMLNELVDRKDLLFNFHNVLRVFSCGAAVVPKTYPTFRMSDPAAYAVIFQRLGIKGKVLDLEPGFGNRAIASAMENIEYYTIPDERFQKALDKGFVEFTGLDYHKWDNDKIDVLLYDNNFEVPDMKKVLGYLKYAKRMMVFVPHSHKFDYQAKYKPKSVIKLKTRWFQKVPDYIFIW
tara:strand:- start:814 stop:2499 length:1686 start_codon:yes stop_codon:yes gene_type:complete